jgi:2-aminoadipate transaminase
MPNTVTSELQTSLERVTGGSSLSLCLGLPDPQLFGYRELREVAAEVLCEEGTALQYGSPESRLKQHIVKMMRRRNVVCREEEVFLTTGAQQGLSLLGQLLLPEAGLPVLVEEAVYPGFRQAIGPRTPQLVEVTTSTSEGIDLGRLANLFRSGIHPAFLYTMSVGHNPLSHSMNAEKKAGLVQLAQQYGCPIVEDDVYGFLQYERETASPLRALDGNNVFYVGSFSKILAPALRVGWIVAPRIHMNALAALKEGSDINTATLSQRLVCRYLDSHSLSGRLDKVCNIYKNRRDVMQKALEMSFDERSRWQIPAAGFFFWLESERFRDTQSLLTKALASGVSFVPGRAFTSNGTHRCDHAIRLSFSFCPTELIPQAVDTISRVAA